MSGCEGLIQGGNYPSSMVGNSLNMPDGVNPFFDDDVGGKVLGELVEKAQNIAIDRRPFASAALRLSLLGSVTHALPDNLRFGAGHRAGHMVRRRAGVPL